MIHLNNNYHHSNHLKTKHEIDVDQKVSDHYMDETHYENICLCCRDEQYLQLMFIPDVCFLVFVIYKIVQMQPPFL